MTNRSDSKIEQKNLMSKTERISITKTMSNIPPNNKITLPTSSSNVIHLEKMRTSQKNNKSRYKRTGSMHEKLESLPQVKLANMDNPEFHKVTFFWRKTDSLFL